MNGRMAADRSRPSFLSPVPFGSGSAAPFGSPGAVFPPLSHWQLPPPGPDKQMQKHMKFTQKTDKVLTGFEYSIFKKQN